MSTYQPSYYCSKCKTPVIVVPNQAPIWGCKCEKAKIIAEMKAVVIRNTGSVKV